MRPRASSRSSGARKVTCTTPGMAADLDRARDRRPVLDLGYLHAQQLGRALEPVVGGAVQVGPRADHRDRRRLLEAVETPLARKRLGAGALAARQRPGEEGQVLLERQQDRPVDAEALEQLDLERDRAGHVAGVACDLAVALQRVHVAHVDAAARQLDRADQDRAGADRVDVQVAVGAVLGELLGRERVGVRRPDQERAEVTRVVRVGHRLRGRRSELAHERPQARCEADEVVRREREDRVLDRVLGQGGVARRLVRDSLRRLTADRHAHRVAVVEGDRVAVRELEGRGVRAAARAADRLLADSLEPRLRVLAAAARADGRAVGIAVEAAVGRDVVAGCGCDRGDLDVLDADRDGVAGLGAGDRHRARDLVPAAQRGRDHRSPAAGRRVHDDVAAILDRPEHLDLRAEQAVREGVDEDGGVGLAGGGRRGGFYGH